MENIKTVSIPIKSLKQNDGQLAGLPKNPRKLKGARYKKFLESIKQDPEMLSIREVVAYDSGNELIVIAGNMRLKAMKELGYKEVPCKILPRETSPKKLRSIAIKDNITFGEFDDDILEDEWDEQELEEWGFNIELLSNEDLDENLEDENVEDEDLEQIYDETEKKQKTYKVTDVIVIELQQNEMELLNEKKEKYKIQDNKKFFIKMLEMI